MKVLIVDDSAFMRTALTKMLRSDPDIEVVGTAQNGEEGLEKARDLKPDVMTLDIEMPVLDGLSTLRRLRREMRDPPGVIICSSLTKEGSHEALKALRYGAADVIGKPGSHFSLSIDKVRDELLAKVKAIGGAGKDVPAPRPAPAPPERSLLTRLDPMHTSVVLIGSSTGGPPTIEKILKGLTKQFPCPIVIVQHMPPMFTRSLSERLNEICEIDVVECGNNQVLQAGAAYIAPGGFQTHLKHQMGKPLRTDIRGPVPSEMFNPSVNTLFTSAAKTIGGQCAAIVLTGMGDDGAEGAQLLREKNAKIISQDRASCVVYGMPRAVEERGLCDNVLDIDGITELLQTLESHGTRSNAAA